MYQTTVYCVTNRTVKQEVPDRQTDELKMANISVAVGQNIIT